MEKGYISPRICVVVISPSAWLCQNGSITIPDYEDGGELPDDEPAPSGLNSLNGWL